MRILVANRGEIALRIIRTIREMGYESVAIYSEVDQKAPHVKLADMAVCVGYGNVKESYLNIPNVLSVATSLGVDAIHPGYGFFSENAQFASLCEELQVEFIGPSSQTIQLMGDKINAIKAMQNAGVPTITNNIEPLKGAKEAVIEAQKLELPVIIKAAGGGGGKGLRIVHNIDDVKEAYMQVEAEAKITDPKPRIYVEKFLTDAKHIEVQVLCDKFGNAVHLGTRDCSMQRNNQKIIEEAPAKISDTLNQEMCNAAIRACKEIAYENAGTFEFLVKDDKFYFLEMNTRLQVEHTVSEMINGIDIVKEQINIADGKKLSVTQSDIKFRGHSIECRINAEDPLNNFMPTPATIEKMVLPGGKDIRLDFGVTQAMQISPYYDSMIGKIISYGADREEAIAKMKIALAEFKIKGPKSTKNFQEQLLIESEFISGIYPTTYIKNNYEKIIKTIGENNVES